MNLEKCKQDIRMFRKCHLHLHVFFIPEKSIVYTFLFLIMLKTLTNLGSLNCTFFLDANDIHIKVMFIWTFWYLICIFLSSYQLVMKFQNNARSCLNIHVGVIGHGYPEDGKTIFQDIGASKAPQSDYPAAPAGSPSDCSTRPAASWPTASTSRLPTTVRPGIDKTPTRRSYPSTIHVSSPPSCIVSLVPWHYLWSDPGDKDDMHHALPMPITKLTS